MNCEVTYEELAAFVAGDVDAKRQSEVREHASSCSRCRSRLASLNHTDGMLAALPPIQPPARAILSARRALSEVTRGPRVPEIMTLEDVAEFLRITPQALGEIAGELPAFELAGQIRVRRARLIEWIQQRERAYTRSSAQSEVAASLPGTL